VAALAGLPAAPLATLPAKFPSCTCLVPNVSPVSTADWAAPVHRCKRVALGAADQSGCEAIANSAQKRKKKKKR